MDALANLSPKFVCSAWSWFTLLCAAWAGGLAAMIIASCFSYSAYSLGYEDACIDHGIAPKVEE